ncbi:MAG: citryl-CoA lyase [Methanomicrobiales archaeon]
MAIGREKLEKMFRISNLKWRSAITKVEPNKIITRGYPQENLIGNISFPEMVFLLLKGELPEKNESKMLESVLVSFCDHGVTPPSTQTARIMASAGSQLPACIAGGLLAFGKNHAGAIERSMKLFQEGISRSKDRIEGIAEDIVNEFTEEDKKIPGFGHRYHTEDPRAPRLIELAKTHQCLGLHTELALAMDKILFELKGIRMNIDGANASILSDLGFDWRNGTGIFMIGRLPAIISHVYEEKTREKPFRKFFDLDEIYYDGMNDKNSLE